MSDTGSTETVLFDEVKTACGRFVGRAILNLPRAFNALGLDMIEALQARLDDWLERGDIVAVWLEGSGHKAFCAGGDVIALHKSMVQYAGQPRNPFVEDYFAEEYRLDYRLHTAAKPIICWGEGLIMGGGMGLMQAGDFRLVTANSRLAMPEVTIGLFPDVGASWFLNRLPGKTGLFLGLTGAHVNARDALALGMADRFMEADRETVLEGLVACRFSDDSAENRRQLFHYFQHCAGDAATLDGPVMAHLETINRLCDAASVTEVVARIQQSSEDDGWLAKARQTLAAGCPQTIHLVWEQLRRGRHLSLAEVFRMEWCLAVHCGQQGDFLEGIRALLVDKDGAPQFRYMQVEQVPADYIEGFFHCPLPVHPLADLGSHAGE